MWSDSFVILSQSSSKHVSIGLPLHFFFFFSDLCLPLFAAITGVAEIFPRAAIPLQHRLRAGPLGSDISLDWTSAVHTSSCVMLRPQCLRAQRRRLFLPSGLTYTEFLRGFCGCNVAHRDEFPCDYISCGAAGGTVLPRFVSLIHPWVVEKYANLF